MRTAAPSAYPFYPCNGPSVEREALPTLVAYPSSHAYRGKGSGMLYRADGATREPDIEEREQLLGYECGATAAEGVTVEKWCLVHKVTKRPIGYRRGGCSIARTR